MAHDGATSPSVDPANASRMLADLDANPTVAAITASARTLLDHRRELAAVSLRVAVVPSFTFDPIQPALELQALRAGIGVQTYLAPFGQFEPELINADSGLASFAPDVVLLCIRLQDLAPVLYHGGFNALSAAEVARAVDEAIERLQLALRAFRSRSPAHLLIQNFDLPATPALGLADRDSPLSQTAALGRANDALGSLARSMDNVRVMDYDALVARHGRRNWTDPRLELFARIAVAPALYWAYAGFLVQHLRPLCGLTKKVLIVDADDTLWGGIVGDVGVDGIQLGLDYPGNAFVTFQKRLLDLYQRGVILGLASKNDPDLVRRVLETHPDMILRAEHFAAMRVNWDPKPDNLRRIAEDLNLGLESFVFLDDSAMECDMMRAALPQVLTVRLPADPAGYAIVVDSLDCFDQWSVSDEDRTRGRLYKADAHRRAARETAVDLPTFYRQLRMTLALSVDDRLHAARAAQMTARTNQFNMHKIACSDDDIRRFMDADDHKVFTVSLSDRFGSSGVVGLAVARCRPDEWSLPLFLISCRALGRTVEQTFLKWIAAQARAAGATTLIGEFVPSRRNKSFAGFYASCGFTEGPADDIQRWVLSLESANLDLPDWMHVVVNPLNREPA